MTKQIKITTASMLFLAVVVFHLYGLVNSNEWAFFTKPFLMITLTIVYLVSVKKPNFWYVSALFFSFWGDVFLLFKEKFFLFGLASFLLAHVLFIKISTSFLKKVKPYKLLIVSVPFALIFISLLSVLKDGLGNLLLPVIIYGITISTFGVVALLNYLQEKSTANLWLFLGAFIFVISDSVLAINKFYEAKEMYGFIIMATYVVAQYLICKAFIVKGV
ncbi:lysoplasmalogenase [Polaribacter batillariae]|uniref:Lysoplasmalogenase n=1 Tax=Polaribacter batillariae TaxID=2808900 RepID=A0ABX7SW74_9FLAO|nr:lysoplasmalogenase [Polaribacter batillariae]QTD38441.1 lysoplasmalogenase [Polaribacter batillariae]